MRKGMVLGIAVVILIGLLAMPAMAAGKAEGKLAKLKAADTNGDGKVTYEEAKAAFPKMDQARFNKLDRNGDGVLTREDFAEAAKAKLEQADTNNDGKVSFEEAKAAFPRMTQERFKKLDRNGDGYLSAADRNK